MLNGTLLLESHYCDEKDINGPKIWYKIDQKNKTEEVKLDMNNIESLNRISVSINHTLTIIEVNLEDAGIYYCENVGHEGDIIKSISYVVDLVFNTSKLSETGNLKHWKQYHNDYIVPFNKKLLNSQEDKYLKIRNMLSLEVITDWENSWSSCEICGRPPGEGIRKKNGFCRIKIENINQNNNNSNETINYFLRISKISCDSLLLDKLLPDVSNITKSFSNFVLIEKCDGVCNPDVAGKNRGWKFGSSKDFKYRRTIVLNEGEHLTLVCPESNLDNSVIWRRNGKVLKQGGGVTEDEEEPPHIIVDAFNSLYLIRVTDAEEGNYTCQVDSIRMQQIKIFVVKKSRIITKEFLRHMMYLSFVLTLSCTCYWAGIIAACKRKHTFKEYSLVSTEATEDV